MVYIFTEPKVTMNVDMIAERIMQMIGFLFLNNASNTSKQNNVCTIRTHISNNLIVMRYKWRIVFFV